jgi:hypothetical protein
MISPDIMGSPVRRPTNPITRCRDQPHYRYAGTDDGRGTDQTLDTNRLTLMSAQVILAFDWVGRDVSVVVTPRRSAARPA